MNSMNFLKITSAFILLSVFSLSSWAQSSEQPAQAAVTQPKLATTLSSYYYDLKGKKGDDRGFYDFNKLNARIDLLSVGYGTAGSWTVNLLVQHYELYTETLFPKAIAPWDYSEDRTVGMGDTYLTVLAPVYFLQSWMIIPDFGVSIPTGSINYKSHLPGLQTANLAYNAQHGSGTYDAILGVTALFSQPEKSLIFGNRLGATIRTGKNSNDYTLGNLYKLDTWLDYNTSFGLTPRFVGYYRLKGPISGYDKSRGVGGAENIADEFYHHDQKDWMVSVAMKYSYYFTPAVSLAAEAGLPLLQGTENWDNSRVVTNYYGGLTLAGQF